MEITTNEMKGKKRMKMIAYKKKMSRRHERHQASSPPTEQIRATLLPFNSFFEKLGKCPSFEFQGYRPILLQNFKSAKAVI